MKIEKFVHISNLLSLYEPLLTNKQSEIMNFHYEEDLSLGEISEIMGVSRQAVHDTIKRCEHILADYEEKLGLEAKYIKQERILKSLKQAIGSAEISEKVKNAVLSLCEELEE